MTVGECTGRALCARALCAVTARGGGLGESIRLKIVMNPPPHALKTLENIIERDDRAILASAVEQADYLLTLDNHFFSEAVFRYVSTRDLLIVKPKDFIELHRT